MPRRRLPTEIGQQAENRALNFLLNQGLSLVARNVRGGGGELDLVMRDGDCVVFVEVRARKSALFGTAIESISATKQHRLLQAATHFLQQQSDPLPTCRFDVVAFDQSEISWIRHAFEAQ